MPPSARVGLLALAGQRSDDRRIWQQARRLDVERMGSKNSTGLVGI